MIIFPRKLRKGDHLRIIAPSRSLSVIPEEVTKIAIKRLELLGFSISFANNVSELDEFSSSSIESRLLDLHKAFSDRSVSGILTVIGGYNSNQLLRYIDWELIRKNPKVFCGYSDITSLQNAIFAKTGLVTYSGPHFSTFGQKHHFDYTLRYFLKCLTSEKPFSIDKSSYWSNDLWWKDQEKRQLFKNTGWTIINEGSARGIILGGNLNTFTLLHGTEFIPNLKNIILFFEDDTESLRYTFERNIQSVIYQPFFRNIKAIVLGRFPRASGTTREKIIKIIKNKKELDLIPVVANLDFGHTDPQFTFPIGGTLELIAKDRKVNIVIQKH